MILYRSLLYIATAMYDIALISYVFLFGGTSVKIRLPVFKYELNN